MNLKILALILLAPSLLSHCSWVIPPDVQKSPPQPKEQPKVAPYATGKRQLFVFMDGTNNDWNNRTNPRRLFEMLAAREDPAKVCCYVSGVGVGGAGLGLVLGKGMKRRILEGYEFLAKNHRPGDEIYIFGFSRGSHQARTLAGMISYCGLLPVAQATPEESDRVWDYCRTLEERLDHKANGDKQLNYRTWKEAVASGRPPAPLYIQGGQPVQGRWAEVTFLGVWDTVPGSQLKEFGPYGEVENDRTVGTRYKIGAYPPIRQIAHAMSLDEMRSKFRPVQVRPPASPSRTKLDEVWFAGVHSDVGGGYGDANALSGVSMNWMIDKLNAAAKLRPPLPRVHQDVTAPQHDELLGLGSIGSRAENRLIYSQCGKKPMLHPSVAERIKSGPCYVETKQDWFVKVPYQPKAGLAKQ